MSPFERSATADPAASPEVHAPAALELARPHLADQAQLLGPMQDSGFATPLWLAKRGESFLQLTELLYRIAEAADGQRTLAEIAATVSYTTGRSVSASNVLILLRARLVPMGLVSPFEAPTGASSASAADTAAQAEPATTTPTPVRSPLKVNVRVRMAGPRVIEPVTRCLRFFFFPPIVIGMLIVVALTQWWVFFVHGIVTSFYATLYQPELLLALVPLTLCSTIFHEFGHATALRYGGGRARMIGAGFYLMYPVFYTDITDNYRLGRWARVRTDLGGFYFNLLFAIGVMALYAATQWEFLLAVVLWTDVEIISQCLPFVRFDGYWVFADLTGIPDSFALIGPFVRSILPARWHGERTLPPLKRWVRAVFAVYTVLTVPFLGVMLLLLVVGVPSVLRTAWQSSLRLAGQLTVAYQDGQTLAAAAVLLQLALLGLTVLGLLVAMIQLGRLGFSRIWRLGRRGAMGRLAATVATLGVVLLLLWTWVPQQTIAGMQALGRFASAFGNSTPVASVPQSSVPPAPSASELGPAHPCPRPQLADIGASPIVTVNSLRASSTRPTPGDTVQFDGRFHASCDLTANVIFQVRDPHGQVAWRAASDHVQLDGGVLTVQSRWAIPAALPNGQYEMEIVVYSADYQTLYGRFHGLTVVVGKPAAAAAPSLRRSYPSRVVAIPGWVPGASEWVTRRTPRRDDSVLRSEC